MITKMLQSGTIPFMPLAFEILDNVPIQANVGIPRVGYFNNRAVFKTVLETSLVGYLLKASQLYYG